MPDPETVLVTGVSGFVGAAVARKLVESGAPVRALMRPGAARAHVADLDIEYVDGDLRDRASLEAAAKGVRRLYHVAASYRLSLRDPAELFASNRDGTTNIMRAALRCGVERIVYTSSVAALALRHDGQPADESALAAEAETVSAYKKSKLAAEKVVHRMIAEEGLPAIVVNPSTPIGPRDVKPTPTGRILVEAASGRMPGFIDTGLNLVHVDDVAAGHLAAMARGRIGERYILGGQNLMLREMLSEIAARAGVAAPRWKIPRAPLYPIAAAAELMGFLTKREPFVTINGLRMAEHLMFFTADKAERELAWTARPWTQGVADALDWFDANGYLRRSGRKAAARRHLQR